MAETITLMIPYYNYALEPFEFSIESIKNQVRPFDEVVVSDFGSTGKYQSGMEQLCNDNDIKYVYTPVDAPPKVIVVHLWLIAYNIGIRNSTSDLVVCGGTDRVYEDNTAKCIVAFYNWVQANRQRDTLITCGGWNLMRMPKQGENYHDLVEEAKWRGGQAWWCTTKDWYHKVRGMDESLRWYADNDLLRRAKLSGLSVDKLHSERVTARIGYNTSCLHIRTHGKTRRRFGGQDVKDKARRGKAAIHRRTGWMTAVRNDETWGMLTDKKLAWAIDLATQK